MVILNGVSIYEPTKAIFPDLHTQKNSSKQKKLCNHLLRICLSVYELKKSQPVVGRLYSVQYKGIFGVPDQGQMLYV